MGGKVRFLIDGSAVRLQQRIDQWSEGVAGQLLTPLTNYRLAHQTFAMDNGCFSGLREAAFKRMLVRNFTHRDNCLFVCVPDKLGNHVETLEMWYQFKYLAKGYKTAFVAQDGFNGYPPECDALFIGGTDVFKDNLDAIYACIDARADGKHVHIGRVNGPERFHNFRKYADTCDGSGISKYDHMLVKIRESCK